MHRYFGSGAFAAIDEFPGSSAIFEFQHGEAQLRVDTPPPELAIRLTQDDAIHARTLGGFAFSARVFAYQSTPTSATLFLDDLVVTREGFDGPELPDPSDLIGAIAWFDPAISSPFFQRVTERVPYAIMGRSVDAVDIASITENGVDDTATVNGISVSTLAFSSLFPDARDQVRKSNLERLGFRIGFTSEASLPRCRRVVMALSTFFDIFGNIDRDRLRELSLVHGDTREEVDSLPFWWARHVLSDRAHLRQSPPHDHLAFINEHRLQPRASFEELGGLNTLAKWLAVCEATPYLIPSIDSYSKGVDLDPQVSILNLAVCCEHLAANYARAKKRNESAVQPLLEVVRDELPEHPAVEEMVDLCWGTYNRIKHFIPKNSYRGVELDDEAALREAAEFLYIFLLSSTTICAGIPLPFPLQLDLVDPSTELPGHKWRDTYMRYVAKRA